MYIFPPIFIKISVILYFDIKKKKDSKIESNLIIKIAELKQDFNKSINGFVHLVNKNLKFPFHIFSSFPAYFQKAFSTTSVALLSLEEKLSHLLKKTKKEKKKITTLLARLLNTGLPLNINNETPGNSFYGERTKIVINAATKSEKRILNGFIIFYFHILVFIFRFVWEFFQYVV